MLDAIRWGRWINAIRWGRWINAIRWGSGYGGGRQAIAFLPFLSSRVVTSLGGVGGLMPLDRVGELMPLGGGVFKGEWGRY